MSVGQNLILPFILFYLPAAVSQTRLWLSAFPHFGLSCPPAQGLPKSRLADQLVPHRGAQAEDAFGVLDQAAAEGPEHQGEQADRGDGEGAGVPV